MKKILIILSISAYVFAAPKVSLETKCYELKDNLDRDYCQKKKAKLIETQYSNEEKTWSRGLMAAAKKAKTNSVVMKIKQKEEELSFIQKELDILKAHKAKLAKVKVVKPKKKKKKKKKNPLDQLGIKL
jgi:hypothetical protein